MKSQHEQAIQGSLWLSQSHLEELSTLNSDDGSFDFGEIKISNKPYINNEDEQGHYIFILDIQAAITTFSRKDK